MSEPLAIRVDGRRAERIPAADRGLHFGDGVFETIAVRGGAPRYLERHLDRLERGAAVLGIEPPARETLRREALDVCGGAGEAVLKLILTRGSGGRGYAPPDDPAPSRVTILNPWRGRPAEEYRNGAAVRWCATRLARNPALAGIKHLNRLEQVLARAEWDDPSVAEGLMLDTTGRVVEGTASNLFLVTGDRLQTPDLSESGVAGIMRARVMELANGAGWPVDTTGLGPDDVAQATELFLTSSLLGILPVGRLDVRTLEVGPVTRHLMEMLDADD